jgi:RimJ/RimL family protein N-acetyltransferase
MSEMTKPNPILLDLPEQLQTPRMLMRFPSAGDGALINPAIRESIVALQAWMPWATPTPEVQDTEVWCRQAAAKALLRQEFHWLMLRCDDGHYLGTCGLHHIDWNVPKVEIGYWIRTAESGKGYITEAVHAITQFAFEQLKAIRVEIHCDDRNPRSGAVAQRAGFTLETIRRCDSRTADGSVRDTRIYVKTRSS